MSLLLLDPNLPVLPSTPAPAPVHQPHSSESHPETRGRNCGAPHNLELGGNTRCTLCVVQRQRWRGEPLEREGYQVAEDGECAEEDSLRDAVTPLASKMVEQSRRLPPTEMCEHCALCRCDARSLGNAVSGEQRQRSRAGEPRRGCVSTPARSESRPTYRGLARAARFNRTTALSGAGVAHA